MGIRNNIARITAELPGNCILVAVSKFQSVDLLQEAYDSGQRHFGENRVQELIEKQKSLPGDIEWHMIGHLQRNKIKHIAPFISLIHSVDSIGLLEEINRQAIKINRVIPCLLQVHIADEETKFGFSEDEVLSLINGSQLEEMEGITVKGLMGMATFSADSQKIRMEFRNLKQLFEKCRKKRESLSILSMGMSGDYKIACEEGSTLVRIGSLIFGQRTPQ